MTKNYYFDNATVARPSDRVVSEMMPFFTKNWGTPASPHKMGQELFPAMEKAYRSIYKLLGGSEDDTFIFTSSGTEAINHVFQAVYEDVAMETGKNHFVTANIENAPAIMSIERLEKQGCAPKIVKANHEGVITQEALGDVISPRTALVSLSWVNSLTGVIQPLDEISDLCKERGILLHVDATQALGKIYFELDDIGADLITFNGPQLHAPQGTGGLFIHSETKLSPFIVGGIEQAGYRAGNMNVAGFIGLGIAADEAVDARDYLCTEVARLRTYFEDQIVKEVKGAQVLFSEVERAPHITAIAFPHIASEALLFILNQKNLFANIGGGETQQLAYLLKTLGVDEEIGNRALSFSLSRETTEQEIDKAVSILKEEVPCH